MAKLLRDGGYSYNQSKHLIAEARRRVKLTPPQRKKGSVERLTREELKALRRAACLLSLRPLSIGRFERSSECEARSIRKPTARSISSLISAQSAGTTLCSTGSTSPDQSWSRRETPELYRIRLHVSACYPLLDDSLKDRVSDPQKTAFKLFDRHCQRLGIAAVPHGFRSSFRDWAAEETDYSREVAEAALAHKVRNQVEAAYRRTDLFDRRRRLMEDWARYLASNSTGLDPHELGSVAPVLVYFGCATRGRPACFRPDLPHVTRNRSPASLRCPFDIRRIVPRPAQTWTMDE